MCNEFNKLQVTYQIVEMQNEWIPCLRVISLQLHHCWKNTTILKACMKNSMDPPYSCTVGVCTTCRAKVHKGEVHMMEREGLSDDEIEEGYVLTCQALPRSSEIELTFE